MESNFSPRETVSELDKFIIGQKNAKRAVSVALRNRWRRKQLDPSLRDEIVPKNILMVGPTGCGKTEISRRLAKLAEAPFVKVEATKFTEVGYVGRDVEQIIRDLVEISINSTKEKMGKEVKAKAEKNAEEKILDILVSKTSSESTRDSFRQKLRSGELNDKEVEIPVAANASMNLPTMDIPGMPGSQMGMINLGDMFGKSFGKQKKMKKMTVSESHDYLLQEETEKLLDQDKINSRALEDVEQNGIVFIDEIDKITSRSERSGADVSREGVQRDLLPLIEGTAVSTKHGVVKTDYILFIASGAFHLSKPSDMLPELQGRLPIRVELESLSKDDFKLILTETQNSLIKQYVGLLGTEKVDLKFEEELLFFQKRDRLVIEFTKYHGAGNDFVIIDDREEKFPENDIKLIELMCHRRYGIGADGLMLLRNHSSLDFEMIYYNADGKTSSMCGNGGRCIAAFAHSIGMIDDVGLFHAIDGTHEARVISIDTVALQMNDVQSIEKLADNAFLLDTGSPHYVSFVEDVDAIALLEEARKIRYSERFKKDSKGLNTGRWIVTRTRLSYPGTRLA